MKDGVRELKKQERNEGIEGKGSKECKEGA